MEHSVGIRINICFYINSQLAQMVKNPPAMLETWIRYLGWEDPLEKGMTTLSSILAWRIPWTEEPGGLQSMDGVTKSQTQLSDFHVHILSYVKTYPQDSISEKTCIE